MINNLLIIILLFTYFFILYPFCNLITNLDIVLIKYLKEVIYSKTKYVKTKFPLDINRDLITVVL